MACSDAHTLPGLGGGGGSTLSGWVRMYGQFQIDICLS